METMWMDDNEPVLQYANVFLRERNRITPNGRAAERQPFAVLSEEPTHAN
jgi:hypothetical protein